MNDIEIGLQMYQKATEFVNKRFPICWGGCAVIFTEDQQYLISVALESFNAGQVCAWKLEPCVKLKSSICVLHIHYVFLEIAKMTISKF